jgi:glucose/arabinose dehydrogenase
VGGGKRFGRLGARTVFVAAALGALALVPSLLGGDAARGRTSGLALKKVADFDSPVYVDNAPGARRLLFVVEQPGRIEVARRGHPVGHPFLDIGDRVNYDGGERGLLSVAFSPNYRKSRRFYVYYTNGDGNNEVDEFKRSKRSATRAQPSSRRRVLLIPHPADSNHNGGQLQFGPDGLLYVGTGDGGCSDDCHDNARHLNVLLGKILRIDPRRRGRRPYTVPRGNPYVGMAGRDEIYSYGLRNPWRFSFNSANGDLAVGDVGQNAVEEVDYTTRAAAKGANFGWPEWEGNQHDDPSRAAPNPTFPIYTYTHSATGGCAIIGGYVVHSPSLSQLNGRYLYSDLCTDDIRSFVPATGGATDDQDTGLGVSSPSSFGEGAGGRIYVASLNGPVYRLTEGP